MTIATPYQHVDAMSLWWLGDPETPTLIGHLQFVATMRGVSLRYDANWLRQGFALSEDLPLRDNAISEHSLFGLTRAEAAKEIALVARCVDGWEAHFTAAGVSNSDLSQLRAQLDRPFLRDQRLQVVEW